MCMFVLSRSIMNMCMFVRSRSIMNMCMFVRSRSIMNMCMVVQILINLCFRLVVALPYHRTSIRESPSAKMEPVEIGARGFIGT